MLEHPNIDPVAVAIGPVQVHWYGLMYLLGFAFAWWFARKQCERPWSPLRKEHVDDLIFYGAIGVVLGGRFGYVVFYNFDRFVGDPLWLLRIWEGGMAFHGGLLGVIVAMWWYARKLEVSAGAMFNFVAPITPVGLGLGRLGNFIGQELWGRPTDLPWGMVFPADPERIARHPSQLYQALLEGLVLFVILYWYSRKPRPDWAVGGLFLACYGLFRFMVEFVRAPDAHVGFDVFGWMTRGQVLSLPMLIGGICLWAWAVQRSDRHAAVS